ncbi:MAG: hypothetical protein H7Y62_05465 [Hyphomicrobium sp.]|nr:hypothetical protein [Hyphomicrobium sp.]
MVDEKLRALREMQAGLLTGRFGPTAPGVENALKLYGRKVSANRRRLSR